MHKIMCGLISIIGTFFLITKIKYHPKNIFFSADFHSIILVIYLGTATRVTNHEDTYIGNKNTQKSN